MFHLETFESRAGLKSDGCDIITGHTSFKNPPSETQSSANRIPIQSHFEINGPLSVGEKHG